ncbi:MAG: acyltransferase [Bacteroidota bacterium]|nr:acyltransferase [Bacteroidota bacterium]
MKINRESYLSGDSIFILDFLRAIACEMVVISHIFALYLFYQGVKLSYSNPLWEFQSFLSMTGVIIFFFMSGIVISNSLFRKVTQYKYSFFNYFIDRFSRIYSGLVPCLIIIYLLDMVILTINKDFFNTINSVDNSSLAINPIITSLFMIQNFPFMHFRNLPFGGVLWTLNIEWWLYLSFGWSVINYEKILRLRTDYIMVLFAFLFFPVFKFLSGPDNLVMVWLFGVMITLILRRWDKKFMSDKFSIIVFCSVLALCIVKVIFDYIIGVDFYDITFELLIGVMILIAVLSLNGKNIKIGDGIKQFIGIVASYSFTLYLIHVVVIGLIFVINISYAINYPPIFVVPFSFIAANIVAYILAIFTEMKHKKISNWIKRTIKHSNIVEEKSKNWLYRKPI